MVELAKFQCLETFRIISINVRGAANDQKRRAIFDKYRKSTDILIVQETHSTKDVEHLWENEWKGKAFFSHGTSSARGIAIFVSNNFKSKVKTKNVYKDGEGRILIVDICDNDEDITLVALYAPNQDSPSFFDVLRNVLKERHVHKIIVGDFNLTLDVEMDRENTYHNNNKARDLVLDIMDEYCLHDSWRVQNGDKREFSWIKRGSYPVKASRIDFALVSGGLDQKIGLIMYIASVYTDHRALYICVDVDPFERGKGYWKFNNSLLQDMQYLHDMNKEIEQFKVETKELNPIQRWENLKQTVKNFTIKYTKRQKSDESIIISQLTEKVTEYESRLPLTRHEDNLLEKTKCELEEKTLERIKGVMFRSKVKWYEEGERNTKYFYALEKMKYNAKTCYKLLCEDGRELNTPDGILEEQKRFYTELYAEDQEVKFDLQNTYDVYVPEDEKSKQEVQLTRGEILEALKKMNNNKTPGEDGIPADFYKVFWTKIEEMFYNMMLQTFHQELLHETARKGVLNLIPKPNKDSRYVKNMRPITLLNVDYKIIEKAVANKILPSLDHIIHKDQRGFMRNRRISVNIRKMLDIIHLAEKEDLEAIVLSLDFVKCFDKCSFSILHGSLEFFEFGSIIKQWTKILYKDFSVIVQNNGHFSTSIEIKKGVHQGGCCSSIYFLIIAEILALSLRANNNIDGIMWKEIKNLLNQFADDMDIFSLCNEKSIVNMYNELETFRKHSGFTVSYDKTTLYRIGSLRFSNAQLYNRDEFIWSNEDITVLGVQVAHENLVEKNYENIVGKVSNILNSWVNRGLSLIGKIQVVNTLIASLFVYKMMVLPMMPKNIVQNVQNQIRNFIWNGKKSKIALNILQLPKVEGGLNLVDLVKKETALKATWPQILYGEEEYSTLVYSLMRVSVLGHDIWKCSISPDDVKKLKISSQFWRDVLISWSKYNYYHEVRPDNQLLWYNSNIRVGGKPIMWADAYKKGLKYVHQLFHNLEYKDEVQIRNEYGISVLRYNSLKAAIPAQWKLFFTSAPWGSYLPPPPHNYDRATQVYAKGFSRIVYKYISEDAIILHNKYIKWRKELGEQGFDTFIDYRDAIIDIHKTTNIPKYKSFQYRLLQRGIVTNVQLEKWKIVETNMCTFCSVHVETINHLFWECQIVQNLWFRVFEYIEEVYHVEGLLTKNLYNILTNRIMNKKNHVSNFLCLITKYYIYRQRCLKDELLFPQLKGLVNQIRCIEKYIAVKNNKKHFHDMKWNSTSDVLATDVVSLDSYIRTYISNM